MLIGSIELELKDDKKKSKITEDIGFNPSRKNIIKNQNFNMNVMTEQAKEDIDKLTFQYLQLSDNSKEDNKFQSTDTTNNFYTGILYPEEPRKTGFKFNNMAYDDGTFLTDKISFPTHPKKIIPPKINIEDDNNEKDNNNINNITQKDNKNEIYSTGFESIPELKHSIPVSFDKLIVNLKDEPGKPKPINPLFFVINGEKPIDKSKFINFRTNPSLFTSIMNKKSSSASASDLDIKKNLKKKQKSETEFCRSKKNATDSFFNTTSRTPKFITCFNKAAKNKSKLNYDLKRTIFNDPYTHIEDKYKILKDLQRNELMNRALGRGIFSCNKNFDDEKRALAIQRRKKFEQFLEDSKEKMVINLRTNIDFFDDKKKSFPDSQKIIAHDYLKLATEEYKKTERFKVIENYRNEEMKRKVENLYRPKSRKKISKEIMSDTKMDKLLKNANFEYNKPYIYLASDLFYGNK